MRVAWDTNFLIYAENLHDSARAERAAQFVASLVDNDCVLPVQVLGEFHRVLRRKFRWPVSDILEAIERWSLGNFLVPTTDIVLHNAMELTGQHQFDIWDAIILASAAEARCDLLLSEDGHSGFTWRGVTVIDPFAGELHPLGVHLLRAR